VGARALERISTLFAVILKRVLSRNLDKSRLKNAYFLKKSCKNRLSVGSSAPEPPFASGGRSPPRRRRSPPDPRVVIPVCYFNFVEFVSCVKCVFLSSKRNKITPINFCFCFFRSLAPIFQFKHCSFC